MLEVAEEDNEAEGGNNEEEEEEAGEKRLKNLTGRQKRRKSENCISSFLKNDLNSWKTESFFTAE